MTTEVDLTDQDGAVLSIAAVDDTFWASSGAWATGYAASKGVGVYVPGGAPQPGSAERNITAAGDWQNWVASIYTGAVLKPQATPTAIVPCAGPSPTVLGASAIGGMFGAVLLGPLGAAIGAALGAVAGSKIEGSS